MRFWSLCRSGLCPVDGRPSFRAFRAAVSVCGLPRPFVCIEGLPGRRRWVSVGLQFYSGSLYRCRFSLDLFPPVR